MVDIRHICPLFECFFSCGITVLHPDETFIGDVALDFVLLHLYCGNRAEWERFADEATSPISLLLEG